VTLEDSLPGLGDPNAAYRAITGKRVPRKRWGCCFTYAVAGAGFVKVGLTNHLTRRLQSLRSGVPFELSLLGFLVGNHEIRVHNTLVFSGVTRVRGEWFQDGVDLRATLALLSFITEPLA
jgi:hypothetical protein